MAFKVLTLLFCVQIVAAKFAGSTISELQQQVSKTDASQRLLEVDRPPVDKFHEAKVPESHNEQQPIIDETDPSHLYPTHNLSVPIDHFHNVSKYAPHSDGTFPLRYWFDASHYKQGGPVIVLSGGETNGAGENSISM